MLGVNYHHLTGFYNLYQIGASPLDEVESLMIKYLNTTVKNCEEAQPQPVRFPPDKIIQLCTKLTTQADAEKAQPIISAVDKWKNQWLEQQGFQPQAADASIKREEPEEKGNAAASPSPKKPKILPPPNPFFGMFLPSFGPIAAKQEVQEPKPEHTKEELLAALTMSTEELVQHIRKNKHLKESYLSWTGENGENIMHLAAQASSGKTLKLLTNLGASLDDADNDKRNCLHYAAEHNNVSASHFLFSTGYQHLIRERDVKGFSPMHIAILKKSGYHLIVMLWNTWQETQSLKLPSGDNELHLAAQNGFLSAFSLCLLIPLFRNTLAQKNSLGLSPLEVAIKEGQLGIVRLISHFEEGKISGQDKQAAISLAREYQRPLIDEFLTTGQVANSPTYEDLKANPADLVELINRGLDVNGLQNGKSMLHRAIEDDLLPLVKLLILEGGALITVKAKSNDGCDGVGARKGLPALYFAASLGRADIVRFLNAMFYYNNSLLKSLYMHQGNPIKLAQRYGHGQSIARVLVNRGWLL